MNKKFLGLTLVLILLAGTALDMGCAPQSKNALRQASLIRSEHNGQELQEKIWNLIENGQRAEAETLKKLVVDTLKFGNCNVTKTELWGGGGPKRVLECDHGIEAIFKLRSIPYPYREPSALKEESGAPLLSGFSLSDATAEIAAYEMDQLLEVNVVPITVERMIPGLGFGSAQYFVKGAQEKHQNYQEVPGYRRMKVLDRINRNTDRWSFNWLYFPGSNRIVAIDNGLSFRLEGEIAQPMLSLEESVEFLEKEPALQKRIRDISEAEIRKVLSPYLRKMYIQGVLDRIHSIKERI